MNYSNQKKQIKLKELFQIRTWISSARLFKMFALLPVLMILVNESFGQFTREYGGIVRGDKFTKKVALVFTGHDYSDGSDFILETLTKEEIKASFFLTGDFYRNPKNSIFIESIKKKGHYLGPHSDKRLLYSSSVDRDSLLIDRITFQNDLDANYAAIKQFGLSKEEAKYFLPPFEIYNDSISNWSSDMDIILINITPGISSNDDITDSTMANYLTSEEIYSQIYEVERSQEYGLNGYILLMHLGVGDNRTDKFYYKLPFVLQLLQRRGYEVVMIQELLKAAK